MGDARAHAVDGLEGGREDGGLCPVKGRGYEDLAPCLALLARDLDIDPSDATGPLEITQIQVFAE